MKKACESFVRWDRGERARRTASRKAAFAIGSQQDGDIVLYCREPRASKHELRRNGRSRLTSFEKNKNSPSEAQLRNSKFASMFIDFSHPRMSIELLVFQQTQTKDSTSLATEAWAQQDFIDERILIADPSRTVHDDQDDDMPESTQTTSAVKRKVDETAKERRVFSPITIFSHANSTRLENEPHEQLTRFTIQARIAKTRAESRQDVSSTSLRARMVDARGRKQGKNVDDEKWRRKNFTSHIIRPRCKTFPEKQDVRFGKHG